MRLLMRMSCLLALIMAAAVCFTLFYTRSYPLPPRDIWD